MPEIPDDVLREAQDLIDPNEVTVREAANAVALRLHELREELALVRNEGHAPECGGGCPIEQRCDCGFFQRGLAGELVDELRQRAESAEAMVAEHLPDHCYRCERPCRYAGEERETGAMRCAACLLEQFEARVAELEGAGKKLYEDFSRALGDAGGKVGDGLFAQAARARARVAELEGAMVDMEENLRHRANAVYQMEGRIAEAVADEKRDAQRIAELEAKTERLEREIRVFEQDPNAAAAVRVKELEAEVERLHMFGQKVVEATVWGRFVDDLDGGMCQDLAIECGVIREVEGGFNPDIHHDESGCCEPGDPFFEFVREPVKRPKEADDA